ncbi:phosphotransferase family protein [Glycomyces harbinensis]|uniref:Predicted kinase, aminoglycoside phosphotransferase (APT) family n=1 Tax=Glycomyces harbinensis TaxID=58114 RepID=A0A1G6UAY0_9ACTN|nr:aminoglycoside phosphotransferase family protein [Glycomyces harbinensis]SDD37846.1 Predicted kinase, aminoglycoside phosphotransferase (APT) family [Glycomyces harbinensis]
MVDFRQGHTAAWAQYFARRGFPVAEPIAAGVEGAVYRLEAGTVAKVWSGRPPADFALTREVYADIAHHRPPFATPEILKTEEVDGVLVSYERELPGTPLAPDSGVRDPGRAIPPGQADALLAVLRGLAAVPGTDAMRRLTVQGDDRPLWQDRARFPDALADLVERAVGRHRDLLAAHVPDLAVTVERTVRALRALPDTPVTVVHGDLVPPNVHVDATGLPVAVLDFGFFTTAGDPAFEAAVTAAVWDMYGPYAEEHVATLTGRFAAELRHPPQTLALYQTAYALATYDLFSTDGTDGHFRWCAALVDRSA